MINAPVDFGSLTPALESELRRGFHLNRVNAAIAAKRAAQFTHAQEFKSVNGLGRLMANIPADAFHYWGQRLGYECWENKQFMHEFLRDNPECRVKSGGTKMQVGYVPTVKRFHKTYAND